MSSSILAIANQLLHVPMFPYFDIAHNFLAALDVREDLYKRNRNIRKYPFLSWLSTMFVTFSGGLAANLLLGEPMLEPLTSTPNVVVATVMWFVVFYSPSDVGYKIGSILPINLLANVLKEIYRAKKVSNGVLQVERIFPHAYLIMIVIGAIRGNGAGIFKQLYGLVRKIIKPEDEEPVITSFPTKSCLIAGALFVLENKIQWISAYEFVYFAVVLFFVYFKVSSILSSSSSIVTEKNVLLKKDNNSMDDKSIKPENSKNQSDTKKGN